MLKHKKTIIFKSTLCYKGLSLVFFVIIILYWFFSLILRIANAQHFWEVFHNFILLESLKYINAYKNIINYWFNIRSAFIKMF